MALLRKVKFIEIDFVYLQSLSLFFAIISHPIMNHYGIRKGKKDVDELKLKLSTKFMRGIVAKLIGAAIQKKIGCDIDVYLNKIEVVTMEDKIQLHIDVDADMTNGEFTKLVNSILY